MTKRRYGRKRGSRNRGYFWRKERGCWYTRKDKKMVPLTDEKGHRLTDPNLDRETLEDVCSRLRQIARREGQRTAPPADGVTLQDVCDFYLQKAKQESRGSTVDMRTDILFDLCSGLPPRFRTNGTPKPDDRIHDGYGSMLVVDLQPYHLESWLDAHPEWTDRRTRLQAVKRALNRAAESRLIPKDHNIRGMKVPKGRPRVTYLSAEQEAALMKQAGFALKLALKVLIRTGMRPGCEFAAMTAAHVYDRGDRIEIRYSPEEAKTKKKRIVRITDAEIIKIIRRQVKEHPTKGPIFRNQIGGPWKRDSLYRAFSRALARAKKSQTVDLKWDDDVCLYSCRHTFAKRMLTGYWTGKPISMELLALLMGNTPKVCYEHYADIAKEHDGHEELIWNVC